MLAGAVLVGGCATVGASSVSSIVEISVTGSSTAPTSTGPPTSMSSISTTVPKVTSVVTLADGTIVCPEKTHPWSPRFENDLDGDGRPETIAVDRPAIGETTIAVCGTGLTVEPFQVGDVNKPAEVFPMDVDADGVAELLVGGPTGGPIRFAGTVLRFEREPWVDLGLGLDVTVVGRTGSSFGCVDIDEDRV